LRASVVGWVSDVVGIVGVLQLTGHVRCPNMQKSSLIQLMAHGHPALVVSLLELSSQMTQVRDASMFGEFQNLILLLIMSKSSKIAAKDNKQQAFVDSVLWLLLSLSSVEIMLCTFVHLSTFVPFLGNMCLSIPMLMLKWRSNTKREQTLDSSPLLLLPCQFCRGFVGHSDNG